MIEQQPALRGLDGDGSCSDLRALPTTPDAHDEAVFTPMGHIGAAAQVNIPKGGVTIVAGAAEHDVFAVDTSGKKHSIAVERQQGVFQEVELFKVDGVADADRRSMVAVAPGDVIAVFQPHHTWAIAVL